MEPELKQLNEELQKKAIVKFINTKQYRELLDTYQIKLVPTQILINSDGTPYAPENAEDLGFNFIKDENENHIFTTHVGPLTLEEMKAMLKEMGLKE